MGRTRRNALGSLLTLPLALAQQTFPEDQDRKRPFPPEHRDDDEKLPNGKSQRDAIARMNYEESMRDVDAMVQAAESLRDDLRKAGTYTVSISSLRKTEEIEKLARKIRGRLKA